MDCSSGYTNIFVGKDGGTLLMTDPPFSFKSRNAKNVDEEMTIKSDTALPIPRRMGLDSAMLSWLPII